MATYQHTNHVIVSEHTENEIIKTTRETLTAFKNNGGIASLIKKSSHHFLTSDDDNKIIHIWATAEVGDVVIHFTANYKLIDDKHKLISHQIELTLDDENSTIVELIRSRENISDYVNHYQVETDMTVDNKEYIWRSKTFTIDGINEAYFNEELYKLHDVYKKRVEETNVDSFFKRLVKEGAFNKCPKEYTIGTSDYYWDDLEESYKNAKIIKFKVRDSLNNYIKFQVVKTKPSKNDIKGYEGYANIVEYFQTEFNLNLFGHDMTIIGLKDNTYEVLNEDDVGTDEILKLDYDLIEIAVKLAKKIYEKEYGVQ